jgi:membrane protein DedA with SNARE-associated domain
VYDTFLLVSAADCLAVDCSESCRGGESRLTEQLIGQLGYLGIALVLILGGLGLPIPEEAPIILAAVLSRNGKLHGPLALLSCLAGVLIGDLVVYFLGFFYGEKVLSLPLTRRLLTRQREAQIKGYFHRHGFKILVSGRFVPGFRTAAYLTAGILKLPTLKLILTDLVAASLTTLLMFALGYAFADQIQSGIREVQQWVTVIAAAGVGLWLLVRYERARRRAGMPVGPPVLDSDDVPLPSADHRGPPAAEKPAPHIEPTKASDAENPKSSDDDKPKTSLETAAEAGDDSLLANARIEAQPTRPPSPTGHEVIIHEFEAGQPPSSIESRSR